MTLGELLKAVEPYKDNKDLNVYFDSLGARATTFDCYRGDYSCIALGYTGAYNDKCILRTSDLYKAVEDAIDEEFYGWKGGEFIMTKDTEIYVACSGVSTSVILSGVHVERWGHGELKAFILETERLD